MYTLALKEPINCRRGSVFLNFLPSRGWIVLKMFLYSYYFLVNISFHLLAIRFEARFVLNLFLFLGGFRGSIRTYDLKNGRKFTLKCIVLYFSDTDISCTYIIIHYIVSWKCANTLCLSNLSTLLPSNVVRC